jgi:hypothetical protein
VNAQADNGKSAPKPKLTRARKLAQQLVAKDDALDLLFPDVRASLIVARECLGPLTSAIAGVITDGDTLPPSEQGPEGDVVEQILRISQALVSICVIRCHCTQ